MIAIFAGGPSLTRDDVNRCRDRVRTIAVNDAYRLAPWADVLYAADARWWTWHEGAKEFQGLKFSLQPKAADWPGVQILENTGETGLEVDASGLRTGRNSGYQAVNLAFHLGASRIILLGFDMQRGPDGRSHWFGEHPTLIASPYQTFIERFRSIVEPLEREGVQVFNASRVTALDCFPRVPLEELLP